jgi:SAM-dependent methyltransferase
MSDRGERENVAVESGQSNRDCRGESDVGTGRTDPVRRARSISSVEQAAALYAEWASSYDAEVFGELGFTGSARIAELLAGVLPDPTLPVIDLGCGTGAVGRRLAELGVTVVDGVDLSPEMLAVAAESGAYRHLTVADLNALGAQPYSPYAASVSAGTFTTGHVGPAVVPRLLDLLRPDGVVAWVIAIAVWPLFEHVLATSKLAVLHDSVEPIRRDGPPEAVMFVARKGGSSVVGQANLRGAS